MPDIRVPVYEAGTVAARRVKFVVLPAIFAATLPLIGCSNRPISTSATDRVDQLFATWNKPDSPGCSVGISRNGQSFYEHGYGMANLDLGVAITPASVLDAASIPKQRFRRRGGRSDATTRSTSTVCGWSSATNPARPLETAPGPPGSDFSVVS